MKLLTKHKFTKNENIIGIPLIFIFKLLNLLQLLNFFLKVFTNCCFREFANCCKSPAVALLGCQSPVKFAKLSLPSESGAGVLSERLVISQVSDYAPCLINAV